MSNGYSLVGPMIENSSRTIEKALAINLDSQIYGTICEIGAGQEVARWFFQAGATAGTVAKTMSAYDMKFSDEIYGHAPGQRYVSRFRLEQMLQREFDLLLSRIQGEKATGTRFFAFANTVCAQGFQKREECHGWVGVRFQMYPQSDPDEIIIHVRMLDSTNLAQQEALGILGVNLIHGGFHLANVPQNLLVGLMDNLLWGRLEIDLVEFNGPNLGAVDSRLMALELVKSSLTRAVLFSPKGSVEIPADALYRNSSLVMRGKFQNVIKSDLDRFIDARKRFQADIQVNHGIGEENILCIAELTMAQTGAIPQVDVADYLARVMRLTDSGFFVLISEFYRFFRLRQYIARYTTEPVALVTDLADLGDMFCEDHYEGLAGGILEGIGKSFPPSTTAYVYPAMSEPSSLADASIKDNVRHVLDYLTSQNQIVLISSCDVEDDE